MTYLSDISLIREELITLIKIQNHINEERTKFFLKKGSQEFYDEFNLFLHTINENVSVAIDLHIEKINEYEKEQSIIVSSFSI